MRILFAVLLNLAPLMYADFAVAVEKSPQPMSADEKAMMDAFARMGEIRAAHRQLECSRVKKH